MGITINSLTKLNSNDYERMIIKKNNYGYSININKEKRKASDYEMVSKRFNSLNDDVDTRLVEVIEFFLENHTISELKVEKIDYHDGKFLSIIANNSKMSLQIPKTIGNQDLGKIIYNKFKMDRDKFIYDNLSINSYDIYESKKAKNYSINSDMNRIVLHVVGIDDMNFVKALIEEKLNNFDGMVYYVKEAPSIGEDMKFCLYGQGIKMNLIINYFNSDNIKIITDIEEIISKHDRDILDSKKMQLKLEGF